MGELSNSEQEELMSNMESDKLDISESMFRLILEGVDHVKDGQAFISFLLSSTKNCFISKVNNCEEACVSDSTNKMIFTNTFSSEI